MTNKVYAKLPKHHITKYIVMFVQLTLSRHWCSRGKAQQQEDLRLPLCSFEKACRAQRPAPRTTNCTPGFCRRTCDTLRHLQSLWSRGNIPWMKGKLNCSRHFWCKSIYYYKYNDDKIKDHLHLPGIDRTHSTSSSQRCSSACPLPQKSVLGEKISRFLKVNSIKIRQPSELASLP